MILSNIGSIGENSLKARFGKNTFSQLKFNSTSFNHSNSKFNILILIIRKSPDKPLVCDVLTSFISPPIFVDSRRKTSYPLDQVRDLLFRKLNLSFIPCFNQSRSINFISKKRIVTLFQLDPNYKTL